MNNAAEKKDLFYMVVLILTFVAVIVGTAFAIYTFLHRQEEGSSAVYTGTLSIEYLSGNIIDCHLLYPTESPTYEDTENVYKNNFKVTNTGTLDSIITVNVEINRNEFSDDVLKYKIFNSNGEELEDGNLSGTGEMQLSQKITLPKESTTEFTMIVWLEETGENQNEEMKKNLTGTLKVDANQKID